MAAQMCIGDSMHVADIAGKSSRLIHRAGRAGCLVSLRAARPGGQAGQDSSPGPAHGMVAGGVAGAAVIRRASGRARSGAGRSWGSLTACLSPEGGRAAGRACPPVSAARRRTSGMSAYSPMNPKVLLLWAIVKHVNFRSPGTRPARRPPGPRVSRVSAGRTAALTGRSAARHGPARSSSRPPGRPRRRPRDGWTVPGRSRSCPRAG
jgi:hypothetical protein